MIEKSPPAWLASLDDGPTEVLWNLRGLHQGWREYPDWMDFLDPESPNRRFKQLQTRLYREALADVLPAPGTRPLRVLDAACGIGRFAIPLAEAGHRVVGVDACLPSLEAAEAHAAAADVGDRLRLIWGDVNSSDVGEGFDLVLAIELLCYLPDPEATARRLAGLLAPGGTLVVSVEAWPGGLLADAAGLSAETAARALTDRTIAVPDDRWVRLIAAPDLGAILLSAELEVVRTTGLFRVLDGPLMGLVDPERLGSTDYDGTLLRLEALMRDDPAFAELPRAWMTVARRPEG